jgi:predicted kinase
MPQLLFLTGAPGSGKSTIARLLVAERPLSLLLDLDLLRGTLGAWRADPAAAGVRARALGLELARAQLERGGDVVVPQFVRRPQLIEQFRDLAARTGSRFVLVALVSSPAEAESRFAARAGSSDPVHSDAAYLQSLASAEPVAQLYTAMLAMLTGFPETRFVETVGGDVEGTLARVRAQVDGDEPGGGGPS